MPEANGLLTGSWFTVLEVLDESAPVTDVARSYG